MAMVMRASGSRRFWNTLTDDEIHLRTCMIQRPQDFRSAGWSGQHLERNMKQRIVILIGFLPNPRMRKRIELEKQLAELHLICWNKGKNMLNWSEQEEVVSHIIDLKASVNPSERILQFPGFARRATRLLRQLRPAVIHVQAFDMLHVAYWYKKRYDPSVELIYEIADLSPLIMEKQTGILRKLIRHFARAADKLYCKQVKLLIVTSQKFVDTYFGEFVPKDRIFYFPNVPDLSCFEKYRSKDHEKDFTVGFIGAIRYGDQIRNLIEATKVCDMNLLMAGYENEPKEFEPLCKADPKCEWVGKFDFNRQVAGLYGKCDVMYAVYDADIKNVQVALPNKLYEAVVCEIPLIVAKNTYLEEIVEQWGVGIAVDHKSVAELVDALNMLRSDRAQYLKIQEACRTHQHEVDLRMYNHVLHSIIEDILKNNDC